MKRVEELRWEWRVPSGPHVIATFDPASRIEAVFVEGERIVRSPAGAAPAGHALPETNGVAMVVSFDARVPSCILRVDGMEISPIAWPTSTRAVRARPSSVEVGRWVGLLLALVVAASVLGLVAWRRTDAGTSDTRTLRAPNGLFVTRFPADFAAKEAPAAPGLSVIVVTHANGADAAVIVGTRERGDTRDPWFVQQRLLPEALAALPRSTARYQETARSEETCAGHPGAVVRGLVDNGRGEPAELWACAFVAGDAGYLYAYEIRRGLASETAGRLRSMLDATELTAFGGPSIP